MQFETSHSNPCHKEDIKTCSTTVEPSGGRMTGPISGWLTLILVMRMIGGLLLVASLVLATLSTKRHEMYDHLYNEVQSECYGRYEMCMETGWRNSHEPKPKAKDEYFLPMKILDDGEQADFEVYDTWANVCRKYEHPDQYHLDEDAPWYCACLEELYYRCKMAWRSPELNVDEILGFQDRDNIISKAYTMELASFQYGLAARYSAVLGLVILALTFLPWTPVFFQSFRALAWNKHAKDADATPLL